MKVFGGIVYEFDSIISKTTFSLILTRLSLIKAPPIFPDIAAPDGKFNKPE